MARLTLLTLLSALVSNMRSCHAVESLTLHRDVVIVGGGSSGTYCAIRLHQMGKSVAVIEKQGRLGGHTNTFVTLSGQTFDYGTQVLVNTTEVRQFFNYLKTPLAPLGSGGKSVTVDMRRSTTGPPFPFVNASNSATALQRYKAQLAKYPNLFRGYNLPDPVPEDLLLPWGDFLKKYDLGPLAYDGFLQFQGMGNILDQSTLYMMKLFNPTQVKAREQNLKVREANGNTQALWDSAQRVLGESAILSANITRITRSRHGVKVVSSSPNGEVIVSASKLIISIPPKLELLRPFLDITLNESSLFGQWNNSYYYNTVLANTSLPANTTVFNYGTGEDQGIPRLPGVYNFAPAVSDLWALQFSSPSFMTDDDVKTQILGAVASSRQALNIAPPHEPTKILAFNNHSPFGLTVSAQAIRTGYYKHLTALEGKTNTFWTGDTWSSGSSTTIWDFNENELLPQVVSSLQD